MEISNNKLSSMGMEAFTTSKINMKELGVSHMAGNKIQGTKGLGRMKGAHPTELKLINNQVLPKEISFGNDDEEMNASKLLPVLQKTVNDPAPEGLIFKFLK